MEGIFRLSGSEKRIKELKHTFDSSDRYGKGLVWDGYTVHDAANVLRRYLNDLPEPVVPLDLYEKFRDPLRGATIQPSSDAEGPQFVDSFDEQAAIKKYQQLITELPPLNRQLLLYILDLLAVFAAKSDENRMTPQNLAAIFQPGMLSHPNHAMAPGEYRLNQCVLIFLIENQDHFLIGMHGNVVDEATEKQVIAELPTVTDPRGVTRTASNASAGADSVRKEGQIRRNRSVSSRHSRADSSIGSHSPSHVPSSSGGLGRSNTVPSKKSPALNAGKFRKADSPSQNSPSRLEPMTPVRAGVHSPEPQTFSTNHVSNNTIHVFGPSQERLLDAPQDSVPAGPKERTLQSLFRGSPADGKTKPPKPPQKKLQKKSRPGGLSISAHSSNASLPHSATTSPAFETANPMESIQSLSGPIASAPGQAALRPGEPALTTQANASRSPVEVPATESTPRASQVASHNNLHPDDITGGRKSPPTSVHSSFNEGSDIDQVIEGNSSIQSSETPEKERRRRWRLSMGGSFGSSGAPPAANLWSNTGAEASTTTIGSGGSRPRKSMTQDGAETHPIELVNSHDGERDGKEDPRGPIGWIKHKYREAKENAEHRRTKSPSVERHPDRPVTDAAGNPRGKSIDIKRDKQEDAKVAEKPLADSAASRGRQTTAVPQEPLDVISPEAQSTAETAKPSSDTTTGTMAESTKQEPQDDQSPPSGPVPAAQTALHSSNTASGSAHAAKPVDQAAQE